MVQNERRAHIALYLLLTRARNLANPAAHAQLMSLLDALQWMYELVLRRSDSTPDFDAYLKETCERASQPSVYLVWTGEADSEDVSVLRV